MIEPSRKTLEDLLIKEYNIDFYQREYKWHNTDVKVLLDDILQKFNLVYNKNLETHNVSKFNYYFMNSVIINEQNGSRYIVDGQQRLTTLTILLIIFLEHVHSDTLKERVKQLVYGVNTNNTREFRITSRNHSHKSAFTEIYQIDDKEKNENVNSTTYKNIIDNHRFIKQYLDENICDEHKIETFCNYCLSKLIFIELLISQDDTPMIFEIINNRGVKLKEYEILKGKLLSKIDKSEVDQYCDIWDTQISKLGTDDNIKDFFTTYIRAKYLKENDTGMKKSIENEFHNELFNADKKLINASDVKNFLMKDFTYFSNLFLDIQKFEDEYDEQFKFLFYNRIAGISVANLQRLAIISSCECNDTKKNEKINKISMLLERQFVLLNINKAHASNSFNDDILSVTIMVRNNNDLNTYDSIFNDVLLKRIQLKYADRNEASIYSLAHFKELKKDDFDYKDLKYILARIELQLKNDIFNECIIQRFKDYVTKTHQNKYDIEHILAHNKENLTVFDSNAEDFWSIRDKLGALLLLEHKQNISSSNDNYSQKLTTYHSSGILWNMTLCNDYYYTNPKLTQFCKSSNLNFQPIFSFDRKALDERANLLFNVIKYIWGQ